MVSLESCNYKHKFTVNLWFQPGICRKELCGLFGLTKQWDIRLSVQGIFSPWFSCAKARQSAGAVCNSLDRTMGYGLFCRLRQYRQAPCCTLFFCPEMLQSFCFLGGRRIPCSFLKSKHAGRLHVFLLWETRDRCRLIALSTKQRFSPVGFEPT